MPLTLTLFAGAFIGARLTFNSIPSVSATSPYIISQLTGLLSLSAIFFTTLSGVQILFREHDSGFSPILYSTPLQIRTYLLSRWLSVFLLALLFFAFLIAGLATGQHFLSGQSNTQAFHLTYYLHPFFWFGFLNTFFCTSIICASAWLSRNKLIVYSSALFLYIAYIVMLLYSGSPLMAGATPPDPNSMVRSALSDPFGLSAFYYQSMNWSVVQRNHLLFNINGELLINRLIVLCIAIVLVLLSLCLFKFRIHTSTRSFKKNINDSFSTIKHPGVTALSRYPKFNTIWSFVKTDLRYVFRSIPFLIISILMVFYLSVELYSDLDQGIRLPEHYATSGRMVNRILSTFHGLFLIVILFYAHELYHRNTNRRFHWIEQSTPCGSSLFLTAKWLSLSVLITVFSFLMIGTGITFQLVYHYPFIQWEVYGSVFLFNSLPLVLSTGLVLILYKWIPYPYLALSASSVFIFGTASGFSRLLGLHHPLLRFQTAYQGRYSDLNGWGPYLEAYSWKMAFGLSLTLILFMIAQKGIGLLKAPRSLSFFVLLLSLSVFLVHSIHSSWHPVSPEFQADQQAAYEKRYKHYHYKAQPIVTHIQSNIHLFPEWNAYKLVATYTLQNKSNTAIPKLFIHFHDQPDIEYAQLCAATETISITGSIQEITLNTPLRPGQNITLNFGLSYQWDGFNGHESFNAIIENGSFLRLSNYFPRIGYQNDYELDDMKERVKYGLKERMPVAEIETNSRNINDFIYFNAVVTTAPNQTVIGIGELTRTWTQYQRRCFQFHTPKPVPFRFGFASGRYAFRAVKYGNKIIQVYYHPKHDENADYLLQNARTTLDYGETHFGPYPYSHLTFAEISGFTDGFNATAYPGSIFMNERMAFHCNINADRGQDVINELAGHEVAHQWWGNQQIHPAEQAGAAMLTESFAMYTELMLLKKMYGTRNILRHLKLHEDMYFNTRGFSPEPSLCKTGDKDVHISYSKGLLSMYYLYRLLGEEKVNHLLKTFLLNYQWPSAAPVSNDFLNIVYTRTDSAQHPLIKEWFEEVITYSLSNKPFLINKQANGYALKLNLKLRRYAEDGKGQEKETTFNGKLAFSFLFDNGTAQTTLLSVNNNSIDTTLLFFKQPVKVIPDPEYDFLLRKRETPALISGY